MFKPKLKKYLTYFFALLIPKIKKCVYFCSFEGMYNDNPKAISKKFHETAPDIPIYWAVSDKCKELLPDYIHKVRYGTVYCWALAACARVVVDNYVGMRFYIVSVTNIKDRLQNLFCRKRKQQFCVSTWHGTPLKKIGIDALTGDKKNMVCHSCTDYVVVGCEYTRDRLVDAYRNCVLVRMYGTPRNDILFNCSINSSYLKKKLSLPINKKIVLFAPTFRSDVAMSGILQMSTIQFDKLFDVLERKFGGEWAFVARVHHAVMQEINTEELSQKYGRERIIDGNLGDDMAEYLACTNVLITDYSGSMFDFALTKRPCFLFSPDREHYENVERGFYLDYDSLPFPKSCTAEELVKNIASFDKIRYGQEIEKFLEDIGNVEDGHASERVVADILHFMETGKKET